MICSMNLLRAEFADEGVKYEVIDEAGYEGKLVEIEGDGEPDEEDFFVCKLLNNVKGGAQVAL